MSIGADGARGQGIAGRIAVRVGAASVAVLAHQVVVVGLLGGDLLLDAAAKQRAQGFPLATVSPTILACGLVVSRGRS